MRHFPRPSELLVLGHHDLDGIVSAAMAARYLRDRYPLASQHFGVVDFHLKAQWRQMWTDIHAGGTPWLPSVAPTRTAPPDGLALVDFPATPVPADRFLFYADHHTTSFELAPGLEALYRHRAASGEPVFHAAVGSCAALLTERLAAYDGWVAPGRLADAAQVAHLVDTAAYTSPDAALDFTRNGPPLLDLLSTSLTPAQAATAVESLARGAGLEDAIVGAHPDVVSALRSRVAADLAAYDTAGRRIAAHAMAYDFTRYERAPTRLKFAEYREADVHYAIQVAVHTEPDGKYVAIGTLSRSPWAPTPPPGFAHPDLARVAHAVADGGGHAYAAGFRLPAGSRDEAARRAHLMIGRVTPLLAVVPRTDAWAERHDAAPRLSGITGRAASFGR